MIDFDALKAPFPTDAISWRAQTVTKNGEKALALAYIDARDVMNRLDEVCTPARWGNKYSHANGKTVCDIGIFCTYEASLGGEWVWKADGAGDSDIEAEKGALSDAFKRAAVRWGIGRYLYDMEAVWVPCRSTKVGERYRWEEWIKDPWDCIKPKSPKVASIFEKPRMRSDLHRDLISKLNAAGNSTEVKTIMDDNHAELLAMENSENQDDKSTALDIRTRARTLYSNFKLLEK